MSGWLLLTGASGKIGSVLLENFLRSGRSVVALVGSDLGLSQLSGLMAEFGHRLQTERIDLLSRGSAERVLQHLSGLDISIEHLVNGARSLDLLRVGDDGVTGAADFEDQFYLDVIVPYELSMRLATSTSHNLKAVVNIGSMYGAVAPNPQLYGGSLLNSPIQYGTSKAALNHLTKELAVRLAQYKVRVNCVAYGGVGGRETSAFEARYASLCPARRMLVPEELIGPVDFLLGEASKAINGQTLLADGGWTLW